MAFGATATSAMTAIAKRRDRHRSIGDVLPFAAARAEPRISAACDHQWPAGAWDAVKPRPVWRRPSPADAWTSDAPASTFCSMNLATFVQGHEDRCPVERSFITALTCNKIRSSREGEKPQLQILAPNLLKTNAWRRIRAGPAGPRVLSARLGAPGVQAALVACLFAALPARAQSVGPELDLRPGQEITFAVATADGRVTVGPARVSKPGTAQPKDGEITVAVVKHGLSPYADLTAREKTADPVDFIATGLVGGIKVDEVRLCGRLDAPATNRIASGSWRVSLNRFSIRQSGQDCRQ